MIFPLPVPLPAFCFPLPRAKKTRPMGNGCKTRPTGVEPATTGSTVRYSNQLSYGLSIQIVIFASPGPIGGKGMAKYSQNRRFVNASLTSWKKKDNAYSGPIKRNGAIPSGIAPSLLK